MTADLVLLGAFLAFALAGYFVGWGSGFDRAMKTHRAQTAILRRRVLDLGAELARWEQASVRPDRVNLTDAEREAWAEIEERGW